MKPLPPADSPEVLARFHGELDLVEIVARQLLEGLGSAAELEDLVSAGRAGLLEAAHRFDPERGVPFRAYANYRVRGAMLDHVRQMAPLSRRTHERCVAAERAFRLSEDTVESTLFDAAEGPVGADAEATLDRHLQAVITASGLSVQRTRAQGVSAEAPPPHPEAEYERAELLALALAELENLPSREAVVLRRFYFEEHRLEAIAADLGVSKSWVSRLHTKAIGRLATRLDAHDACRPHAPGPHAPGPHRGKPPNETS